jgi:hypothetical protein
LREQRLAEQRRREIVEKEQQLHPPAEGLVRRGCSSARRLNRNLPDIGDIGQAGADSALAMRAYAQAAARASSGAATTMTVAPSA